MSDGRVTDAPIWQAVFNRDGRHFGYRYQTTGIHEDFQAASGFISRGGVITTNVTHRATWFGAAGAPSGFTARRAGPAAFTRAVRQPPGAIGWLEENFHTQQQLQVPGRMARRRVGAVRVVRVRRAVLRQLRAAGSRSFGIDDPSLHRRPQHHQRPFTLSPSTRRSSRACPAAHSFLLWGRDENFYEVELAPDPVHATLTRGRPNVRSRQPRSRRRDVVTRHAATARPSASAGFRG